MGAWGPGIYSNDTASDVRDTCQEIFAFVSLEEGNKLIFNEYKELLDMNLMDDDYASFWYALADWQWKHGMLIDEIKDKTLKLLENYTGLSEWEADASKATVKKRKDVLDKLKEQLLSPQPPLKKPKSNLKKPKHKPGDIIILKSDSDHVCWNDGSTFLFYKDKYNQVIDARKKPLKDVYLGNKYIALLCVGSVFEKRYSRYIDIMDEYSVYAVYDYISDKEPDINDLKEIGFLPAYGVDRVQKQAALSYRTAIDWCTKEHLIKKMRVMSEFERFQQLRQSVGINDNEIVIGIYPYHLSNFYITKLYFEHIGLKISTLIEANIVNPEVANYNEWCANKPHLAFDTIID